MVNKSSSSDDEEEPSLNNKNIEKILNNEFNLRKEDVNMLEFSFCISFTNYLKTLIEIYKKISKTIDFYILNEKDENKGVMITCSNNSLNKTINLKSIFYKDSFIDYLSEGASIHFQIYITDFLLKIKSVKRNYFFKIFKYKEENFIRICNIPFLQLKINKLNFNNCENFFPLSGVIFNNEDNIKENDTKISLNFFNRENFDLGEELNEKLYYECLFENKEVSPLIFSINSNLFCKIISFFNKNKLNNIIFYIEKYKSRNIDKEDINILKIKGNYFNESLNLEKKEFYLYNYENLKINEKDYFLEKVEIFDFPLTNINYFIKIKNLNQETNNILKLRFYKKNLFIESLINNLGIFTININDNK